ncbi:unnamed protein product, partial [Ectocarpus sp. 8 AP-2014]
KNPAHPILPWSTCQRKETRTEGRALVHWSSYASTSPAHRERAALASETTRAASGSSYPARGHAIDNADIRAMLSTVRNGVIPTVSSLRTLKRWIRVQVPSSEDSNNVGVRGQLDVPKMAVDIDEVLRLEAELKTSRERETSSVSLDAKVNLLKYLQVHAVNQYEEEYDNLYYELNRTGGLDCLRSIAPVRSTGVFQPKVLDLQDCSEDEQLEKQLEFYLADAEFAKPRLDELVTKVARDSRKYEVRCVEVKTRESTRRKASREHDGNVRKVADMARVTVVCATPEALEEAYLGIMGWPKQRVLRVKNGFISDWMPSGYRDVKLNPVVSNHLCEIQLQLREFFDLKGGQHAVYEWARELNVTTEMRGEHLFKSTSPEVTKEMMRLAGENWCGTEPFLQDIQFATGQYDLAEKSHRQLLGDVEHEAREFEEHDSKESRRALLRVNTARARLARVLEEQGKHEEAELLYGRVQAAYEKALGPEHPSVATNLNNRAGLLFLQGKYAEAEPLYERSQAVREKTLGPEHPDVASALNNRAVLMEDKGKYAEAELLFKRSQAIRVKALGPEHPEVASSLSCRAALLQRQGKYAEAKPLYEKAQVIREKLLGPEHPDVATSLNNRAELLTAQGKYEEADLLSRRAVAIIEVVLGPQHPRMVTMLNNRAGLLENQAKYEEAEPLYERCLAISEKSLGPDHPEVATILNNRAGLLRAQLVSSQTSSGRGQRFESRRSEFFLQEGKYEEAEPLYIRSLAIDEKVYGPDHPKVATSLNDWARLLESQGKYDEAEPLYERSQSIRETVLGPEHPDVAQSLNNRAGLLTSQGKHDEAEALYRRSLAIDENVYGPAHPKVATGLNNWAALLKSQGKYDEAEPLYQRAQEIVERSLGRDHPNVATILNNRALVLGKQLGRSSLGSSAFVAPIAFKYEEAGRVHERSFAIRERLVGRDHPHLAIKLNNWASSLHQQGKYAEAEPLYARCQTIFEKTLGSEHPNVATLLNNRAELLSKQEKYTEAISLLERALSILAKTLGENHPQTVGTRRGLELVRTQV